MPNYWQLLVPIAVFLLLVWMSDYFVPVIGHTEVPDDGPVPRPAPRPSRYISVKKLNALHMRAVAIASQSHDIHRKVAALLINPETLAVSADGFNGFIRGGADDKLPTTRPEKYDYIIHAEANLLCNAVRNGVRTDGCVVYTTLSPCKHCLRLLWQAGIREFYFKEKYTDFDVCTGMMDMQVELVELDGFFYMLASPRLYT